MKGILKAFAARGRVLLASDFEFSKKLISSTVNVNSIFYKFIV